MFIHIVVASVFIMIASLVGVFSTWKFVGVFVERHLKYLVSFSAGVFAVIAYTLLIEAIELSSVPWEGGLWVLGGVLLILVFFKVVPGFHHHHDEECHGEHCDPARLNPRRVLMSDSLHNIGDGILLTASFALSATFGVLTAVSVFIHELVQELSEFFVLKEAGYSVKKALKLNFLVSGTILIGSIGSFFLLETFHSLEGPLIGIAAGSFIVVVLFDLIPHSVRHSRAQNTHLKHITWFLIGLILMVGVNGLVSEGHTHDDDDDYHDEENHESEVEHYDDLR